MITFLNLGKLGRLGNQLFQIASTMGIAKKNNFEFGFPEWSYSKYFEKKLPIFKNGVVNSVDMFNFCYEDTYIEDNTNINGYLQSYKYFENLDVCEFFNLKSEYRDKFKNLNLKNSVSIHVRRGDYLNCTHVYPILPIDYYEKSIDLLLELGTKIETIFIFSDDMDWCKSNFNFENQLFVEGYEDILDLFIMSECENNIISNSTFSWWAAFLNKNVEKKVICPNKWFNNNNEIKKFEYNDLIPKQWIKIEI